LPLNARHQAPIPRNFMQCDVFSTIPTGGNGLAVVLDGDGLSDAQMQAFARWTNLAETTFVCQPTDDRADYDIRIFTASRELPFAGHPTLGTAACWLDAGNTPKTKGLIRQNCGVGIVEIDLTGKTPAFIAPPTKIHAMHDDVRNNIVDSLGLTPARVIRSAVLDNGPEWHVIELADAEDVFQADTQNAKIIKDLSVGLIAPHTNGDAAYEVRMIDLSPSILEDPITGSLNAALAHWMQSQGRTKQPYTVAQGTCIGRHGRVHVVPSADNPDAGPA